MEPKITIIQPAYERENGLQALDLDSIEQSIGFKIVERSVVQIPVQQYGGNHKHPRTEIIIGLGDLELIWSDENNKIQKINMNDGVFKMIEIPPNLPHAVLNKSQTSPATLIEYANSAQYDVERVSLI